MTDGRELYARCLKWMDEVGACVGIEDDLRHHYWCCRIAPPEDLREVLDEMARNAVVDNDGDPTAIVRGWLDDPELADEKDLGSDSLTQRGD